MMANAIVLCDIQFLFGTRDLTRRWVAVVWCTANKPKMASRLTSFAAIRRSLATTITKPRLFHTAKPRYVIVGLILYRSLFLTRSVMVMNDVMMWCSADAAPKAEASKPTSVADQKGDPEGWTGNDKLMFGLIVGALTLPYLHRVCSTHNTTEHTTPRTSHLSCVLVLCSDSMANSVVKTKSVSHLIIYWFSHLFMSCPWLVPSNPIRWAKHTAFCWLCCWLGRSMQQRLRRIMAASSAQRVQNSKRFSIQNSKDRRKQREWINVIFFALLYIIHS